MFKKFFGGLIALAASVVATAGAAFKATPVKQAVNAEYAEYRPSLVAAVHRAVDTVTAFTATPTSDIFRDFIRKEVNVLAPNLPAYVPLSAILSTINIDPYLSGSRTKLNQAIVAEGDRVIKFLNELHL